MKNFERVLSHLPHPHSPAGKHSSWPTASTPGAGWRNRLGRWAEHEVLSSVVDALSIIWRDAPTVLAFFRHYLDGSGDPIVLKEIPTAWQDFIVKDWAKKRGGKPGTYKDYKGGYDSGIFDLRNSMGHFDLTVTRNADGTMTYAIYKKSYNFHYHKGTRHGFNIPSSVPAAEIKRLKELCNFINKHFYPNGFVNPGGVREYFEIKVLGKEKIFFIPQQFLERNGKEFSVSGSFTVGKPSRSPSPQSLSHP